MKVKICGICSQDGYDAAADAGAAYAGFVFFPPSPRFLPPEAAGALNRPVGPTRIGLFVDPTDAEIAAAIEPAALDILQIYASAERAADLRVRFGLPVWHAIGVATAADLPHAAPGVDQLLLDAKAPHDAVLPGGNAHSFDWTILRGWTPPAPWLLAGGLTPDNVADAVRLSGATAVDVSSGVERGRGIKDPALIRAFVVAATASPSP